MRPDMLESQWLRPALCGFRLSLRSCCLRPSRPECGLDAGEQRDSERVRGPASLAGAD